MFYPLKFKPIYKEKIWGSESWKLAAHENGNSVVINGHFKDRSLTELVNEYWTEIMGTEISKDNYDKFPLLVKILDANDRLSVQVHPDDEYAAKYEDGELGKTEMWYIIDAEPGAELIYGLKEEVTKEEFANSIDNGTLVNKLNSIPVKKGDIIFIPTGTVHTIKSGILLAEIQQNSDTTYRVYDWNRLGNDGKPRALHIDKALDVIDFDRTRYEKAKSIKYSTDRYQREILAICEYFVVERLIVSDNFIGEPKKERFEILLCLDGQAKIEYDSSVIRLNKGETVLIPAALNKYTIQGEAEILRSYITNRPGDLVTQLLDDGLSKEEVAQIGGAAKFL
ncbi:MAG: mannose-6-phosphate isomerase [Candidatus Frackibacter sp. T328-2]|nr:MAG: mannose-6-phosphate isomerase [Candidatus Frackibacter sp. T328-2]